MISNEIRTRWSGFLRFPCYFPIATASSMVFGKVAFLVSGSNKLRNPTAIFTMAKMMNGVVMVTFLPLNFNLKK